MNNPVKEWLCCCFSSWHRQVPHIMQRKRARPGHRTARDPHIFTRSGRGQEGVITRLTARFLIPKPFPARPWRSSGREVGVHTGYHNTRSRARGKNWCLWSYSGKDRPARQEKGKGRHSPGCRSWGKGLTQGDRQCKVLQHHVAVQASLSLIKEPPLLPGEVDSHILKGHMALSRGEQLSLWAASFPRTLGIPSNIHPPP